MMNRELCWWDLRGDDMLTKKKCSKKSLHKKFLLVKIFLEQKLRRSLRDE